MEGKLQTSFIPKQPLVESGAKKTSAPMSIFSIIGWFIFVVVVVAAGGVYGYAKFIENSIASKNADLATKINSFDTKTIDHFVQLDSRLQAAETILDKHLAVSGLFDLISSNTVQSVQFNDFKYSYDDNGKLSLVLNGKAPNFASVALQSDNFSAQPYFRNQVFSNLGLDRDGGVLFKFTASIDQSVLKYKGN